MANMTNTTRNIPSELPEVEFVDTDTEALVNKLIAGYEEITGRTLYPADPVRAFILWLASVIIQERVNINESAKQNLPRYATGQNLDSLSEIFHNTYRLQPTAARTTLGFSITTALDKEYVITDEIEVTVDGYINFVTTGYLTFPAGETYAEVEAVCTTLGEDGNGFTPGQVSRLVTEEFLYFKEVANTTETAGGSGEESDTAYYNRMRESEESYTTAGPRGSYIYHAKAVSSQISDVSAESPQDGVADIRIMLYGGELPSEELIKEVQAYLSADDAGCLKTVVFDIFGRAHMQTVVKESETFAFTGKSGTGNIFYGNLFGVMFMNVDHHQSQAFVSFVKLVFGLHQRQCKFKNLKPDI